VGEKIRGHIRSNVIGFMALFALIVVPVALAATDGGPQATASGVKQKVKKLTKQVRQLQQQLDALASQTGPQGPAGQQGPPGPSTGRAYAYVEPSDCPPAPSTCAVPSRSKGVSQVSRAATGFYCITAAGIDSRTTAAAVTVDWFNTDFVDSRPGNASAMYHATPNPGSFCPGAGDFVVTTEKQPVVAVRNSADDGSVNVSGPAAISDKVAFTIVIP
jgi:hypothetical protein